MTKTPLPQQIYRHFKGNLYKIVTLAKHSETGEELVIYQALYGDFQVYARPLSMFMEKVDREKYPNAVQEYRFELCTELIGQPAEDSAPHQSIERAEDSAPSQSIERAEGSAQSQSIERTESTAQSQSNERTESASQSQSTEKAGGGTQPAEQETEEELNIDPLVLEFLDADSYEQRLNILAGLHHRITDDMINTMAISVDLEVDDGDLEERYEELKNCLLMLERFECNRLR